MLGAPAASACRRAVSGPSGQHDEPALRHGQECLDDDIHPLVGHQARGGKVIAPVSHRLEMLHGDRRINHLRIPANVVAQALAHIV